MATTSNPKVTIQLLASQLAQTVKGRNDLIVGTVPEGATAVDGTLYTDVANKTNAELNSLFVANSDIRNRIDQFIASNDGYSQLDVKIVAEGTGAVKAVGTLTLGTGAGIATEDGEYLIELVDDRSFFATVSVKIGQTDEQIIAKIVTALSSTLFPTMPMTVAIDDTDVFKANFTSIDGGTIANNYKLKVTGSVAGVGTPVVVEPTGGDIDPVVTTFFDNLQSSRFTGINWPTSWLSQVVVVKDYLDARFNASNAILDGVAFIGMLGDYATVKDIVDSHNSQSLCFSGAKEDVFQPADWTMAYFQGIRSRRLTTDAPLGSYITTTAGTLDLIGSPALASLPYFNSPLYKLNVVDPNLLYSNQEQEDLETAGFSVYGSNDAQNLMITGSMVTTYTTDISGSANESFHYLNYVDTASICREYFFNNLKARFSQSRLTNGTLVPNRSIENELSIRAEFGKIYKQLSLLALTVAGSEAEKYFSANLDLELDLASRSVTASFQMPIVTQFGRMDVVAQLNFNFKKGV